MANQHFVVPKRNIAVENSRKNAIFCLLQNKLVDGKFTLILIPFFSYTTFVKKIFELKNDYCYKN